MNTESPPTVHSIRWVPAVAASLGVVAGSVGLVHPTRHLERGTAAGLVLCALSMWWLRADQPTWNRRAGQVAAGIAAVIAAVTFQSGRTPFLTALGLVVTGLALMALALEARLGPWPYQVLAVATVVTSLPVALAETYGMTSGREPAYLAGGALLSALPFLLLGLGVLLARPQEGVGQVVFAPGPGGVIARRVFPAATGALILLSWLRFQGEQMGLYSFEVGLGLMVTTMIVVLALLLYWGAAVLEAAASEQRRVETALRQSHTMFQSFFAAAPDAVIGVDPGGLIVQANSQAESVFGYSRDELLGRPVEQLIPERLRQPHVAHRAGFISAPHARPMGGGLELLGRRKDGSEFPVDIMLGPVQTVGGLIVLSTIRDITERIRMERALAERAEELARSNAELGQFAYVASHDLQEPLRMVASFTDLLAQRYRGRLDADADEFIHYVVDGAKRMQTLIGDLLAYSRVGTRGRAFAPTDCEAVLDGVLSDLGLAVAESGGTVTHDPLPTVLADESQLRQLFQNLISNALRFRSDAPPRVHLAAAREGKHWRLAVRDNGIGIAAEHAERIFVIFQRLHTRSDYPGTGIGLAICKKIVERHGGRIWVESQPGQGATFHFTLPARDSAL